MIADKTIAEGIFLLKSVFEATATNTDNIIKTIALKQYEDGAQASIKIPVITPVIPLASGEWKIEKAVSKGKISNAVAVEILMHAESV